MTKKVKEKGKGKGQGKFQGKRKVRRGRHPHGPAKGVKRVFIQGEGIQIDKKRFRRVVTGRRGCKFSIKVRNTSNSVELATVSAGDVLLRQIRLKPGQTVVIREIRIGRTKIPLVLDESFELKVIFRKVKQGPVGIDIKLNGGEMPPNAELVLLAMLTGNTGGLDLTASIVNGEVPVDKGAVTVSVPLKVVEP